MSENLNPFDDHIRRRLSDHESPVPDDLFDRLQARRGGALPSDAPLRERLQGHESPVSDTIFNQVLTERERRKRRRVVFWRTAIGIAAVGLLAIILFELNTSLRTKQNNSALNSPKTLENSVNTEGSNLVLKNKNSDLNSAKTLENSVNTEGSNFELKNKNSDLNSAKTLENSINTEGGNAELNTSLRRTKQNNSDLNSAKTLENNANTEGGNAELNTSLRRTKQNKSDLNSAKTLENSANTERTNVIARNEAIELNTSLRRTKQNNSDFNNAKTLENSANTEGGNSGLNFKNGALNTALNTPFSPNNTSIAPLDFLNILTVKTLTHITEKRENPCSDPENGCPTFGGKRRGMRGLTFYVDAYSAPEYIFRSFKTNLLESEKLKTARETVEKTQYAVSSGVRVSVVFRNGLAVRTGAVFSQINERARFDSLGVGSVKTTYDVRILPNGQHDTVSITTVITDGIFRKTRYNHYRSIDIPIQIGYEIPSRNAWTLGINGGINANITAWQKADIVGTDLGKQTVSSDMGIQNPVFRTQLGMTAFGSVALYGQLTSNLQLVIEPSVRYGLQPITRSDYALKQQYTTAGLIMGVRLRL